MSIVRCVHCHEEVRVPPRVSPQATVECPRCGMSFELSDALADLPPLLIVVVDPGASEEESDQVQYEMAPAVPRFDFEEREAPAAISVSRAPSSSSMASRAKRREASSGGMLLSAIAVVGGGACALPLAQLVLWWVFGQDPVDLGPKVAQYASLIVPEKFRGSAANSAGDETESGSWQEAERGSPRREPPGRVPAGRTSQAVNNQGLSSNNQSQGENSSSNEPSNTDDNSSDNSSSNDSLDTDSSTTDSSDSSNETTAAQPTVDSGLGTSPLENPVALPEPRERPASLSDLEPVSDERLNELLSNVILSQENWLDADSFSDDERPARLDSFYDSYCVLGEALARYIPNEPTDQWYGNADRLLGSIEGTLRFELDDVRLRKFLGDQAITRLESALEGEGLALLGSIDSVERGEAFDWLVIRVGEGDGQSVRVASWVRLPSALESEQTVVVLGRIESASRVGLDAEDANVVLGGFLMLLDEPIAN